MKSKDRLDVLHRKRIELHDLCVRPKCGWHNAAGLILAIDLHQHPCLVHPVPASPLCTTQEMEPGAKEDMDCPSTHRRNAFVRNLNEESCRHIDLPSVAAAALSFLL